MRKQYKINSYYHEKNNPDRLSEFGFQINLFGQDPTKLGQDDGPILNQNEAIYLNKSLVNQQGFDFTGKKTAFAAGNNASRLITKRVYVNQMVKLYVETNAPVVNHLILLNATERQQSGGYDAVVVAWSKMGVAEKKRKQ